MSLTSKETPRPRVLIAKPGLDGHDRGAKVLARALRDAGMEVIYTGLRQRIGDIMHIATQEDVDVVGLSVMSGGAVEFTELLIGEMREGDASFEVIVGGTITAAEVGLLRQLGVKGIFPVGSTAEEVIAHIRALHDAQHPRSQST